MSGTITFTDGSNPAEIAKPEYGYEAEISMPITFSARSGTSYGVDDASDTYDIRMCRGASFILTAAQMDALADLLRDSDKGRGVDLTLSLGSSSGFFPFGPDLGDEGNFTVRVTRFEPGGQVHRPWMHWRPVMDMALITAPSYSVVDDLDDGTVQMGTVTGLRYPQTGYEADVRYALNNLIIQSSAGHEIDMGALADTYESNFTFSGNGGKIGALIAYLIATGRGTNISFVAPANNYPFGRDKAANGTFTVQCLYTEIGNDNRVRMRIRHDHFDEFSVPLRMRFISVA